MTAVRTRVNALLANGEARARLLFWMWVASLGVLVIGFTVIGLRALRR